MAYLIPDNLKSRSDVPAGIRRVASAFQVGLDENAVVWYEPLYDPSKEKPHLVILLPDRGILVLEVLEIASGGILGALRGRLRLQRDGREIEVDNPLNRAEHLAEILKQRIAAESRLTGLEIPLAAGAVFPYLEVKEAKEKGIEKVLSFDRCLFRQEIDSAIGGTGESQLIRAFAQMLGGFVINQALADKEKVLRGLIQPEIVIDQVANTAQQGQLTIFRQPEGGEDVVRVMDRQQEAMAKSLGEGHRVIRGVAGSGKTLILVYRARLLARMFPQNKYLLTCFTRSLSGQLRALLREETNVEVVHLDKLMAKTIRAARMKNPGFNDDAGDKVATVACEALQRGAGPRYRAVLLDEAQDFSTNALRFAVGLLQPGNDDFVVVADAAQNIFRRKFSWKQAGIQAQGRTRILRVNYRNTREILEFASGFLLAGSVLHPDDVPDPEDENAIIPPESAARTGSRPMLHVVGEIRDEIECVVNQVKNWVSRNSPPRHVAVLYGSGKDGSVDRAKLLHVKLKENGIGVFWLVNPQDPDAKDRLAESTDPVVLSTIHSAKGIEFPYVVLCGIWREGNDAESNRKLGYVGMTRATDYLTVVTREGHPLVGDLQKAASA